MVQMISASRMIKPIIAAIMTACGTIQNDLEICIVWLFLP